LSQSVVVHPSVVVVQQHYSVQDVTTLIIINHIPHLRFYPRLSHSMSLHRGHSLTPSKRYFQPVLKKVPLIFHPCFLFLHVSKPFYWRQLQQTLMLLKKRL